MPLDALLLESFIRILRIGTRSLDPYESREGQQWCLRLRQGNLWPTTRQISYTSQLHPDLEWASVTRMFSFQVLRTTSSDLNHSNTVW